MTGWEIVGWTSIGIVGLVLAIGIVTGVAELYSARRRDRANRDVLQQIIHTDSHMFANCLRLSVEHFRALNRLRNGGSR